MIHYRAVFTFDASHTQVSACSKLLFILGPWATYDKRWITRTLCREMLFKASSYCDNFLCYVFTIVNVLIDPSPLLPHFHPRSF